MTEIPLPFALPAVAFAGLWLGLCILAATIFACLRDSLARLVPSQRSAVLLALALLPLVVAGLVSLVVFAPVVGGQLVDPHCHETGCEPHVPVITMGLIAVVTTSLILVGVTSLALSVLGQALIRSVRLGRTLVAVANDAADRYRVIDTAQPRAYCVGLLRPQILVSRGMLERLSADQLQVVVAHESAHAARYDNLRNTLAGLCTLAMPAALRRPLLADLRLSAEQACDRYAARCVGDPVLVADTLVRVKAAVALRSKIAFASAFCAHSTEARVKSLLEPRDVRMHGLLLSTVIVSAYLSMTYSGAELAHHGIEFALSMAGW